MPEPLTRAELRALLGPEDDATLSEILDLGVGRAELLEAWADNDEAMLNEGRSPPSGPVLQIVELLKARDEEHMQADGR
jgi:hypothetical protein